ncbi:MAG: hypothetical protein ACPGEC_04295 [Flavobacteriales bacterium]
MKYFVNILIFSALIFFKTTSYAQNNLIFSAGASAPELLHLGLHYQIDASRVGLSYGLLPKDKDANSAYAIALQCTQYVGRASGDPEQPKFIKFGYTYVKSETEWFTTHYNYINAQFGKEYRLFGPFFLRGEFGLMYEIDKNQIVKKKKPSKGLNLDFKLLPTLGVSVCYRL